VILVGVLVPALWFTLAGLEDGYNKMTSKDSQPGQVCINTHPPISSYQSLLLFIVCVAFGDVGCKLSDLDDDDDGNLKRTH